MANRCLLYYITDRSQFRGDEGTRRQALLAKVAEAASAGVDYVQLREKDLSARDLEVLATDVLAALRDNTPRKLEHREPRTRLLINSRTDVALAAGADGVHLRHDDVALREVRRMLELSGHRPSAPDRFLIAASCHSAADVVRAESEAVDFAVFAPMFGKRNAPGIQPTGLDALREASNASIPVIALGGVTIDNAASCLQAGAAGVAGIRLFQENRIEDIVRALRAL
jgi:thiamine-phosphate pyrophosphorylase